MTPGSMRVSDADRDEVAAELREHHADGRLDMAELGERLDAALAARTRDQLDAVLVDLPPLGARAAARDPGYGLAELRRGAPARRRGHPFLVAIAVWALLSGIVRSALLVVGATGAAAHASALLPLLLVAFVVVRRRRRRYRSGERGDRPGQLRGPGAGGPSRTR